MVCALIILPKWVCSFDQINFSHISELVNVSFRCKDGSEITKKFLLDNGRLQLEPIKQTFCLDTVEIFLGRQVLMFNMVVFYL